MIKITDDLYCSKKELGAIKRYGGEDEKHGYYYLLVLINGQWEEMMFGYNYLIDWGKIVTKQEAKCLLDYEFNRIRKEYDEAID